MSEIPHRILSDAIQTTIAGRRLRAAAFFTFEYDPGFFEQEVLPAFFDVSLSHVPEIRLLSLAEQLRTVEAITVYYDPRVLVAGAQSSHLDIQRVPVLRNGYFHPKIVLALLDDALLVAMLSANLTRSGWWENVEVAHIVEVKQDQPCSFRNDLLDLIRRTRRMASHVGQHDALDVIEPFVRRVAQDEQRMRDGAVLPRLFFGDGSVVDFIRDIASNRLQRCNLEVISPFFDDRDSLLPIESLKKTFHPREIRVFLPRKTEGDALCSENYYAHMSTLAKWASLPNDIMSPQKNQPRRLHAKVYRFFDPKNRYEAFFVGSPNLTNAGLETGGNVESGFFVEVTPKRKPDWWMSIDANRPAAFVKIAEDEAAAQGHGWKLSVRYHWQNSQAACFWDDAGDSPPLSLLSGGVEITSIAPLPPRTAVSCSAEQSNAIEKALRSGSFLTVRIDGEPDTLILVQEDGMSHKPSLMARISANDILRYWSLLTPDQKKEFLEEHADAFKDPEIAMWLGSERHTDDGGSFFSTFAQIYLSFGNLERMVRKALSEGRPREAVDRLFGQKFDSLRRLIEGIQEEHDEDPVRRYIILLCARQFLDILEEIDPEFTAEHRQEIHALRVTLASDGEVRGAFTFGTPEEREHFFRWFDRWFLRRALPQPGTGQ